MISVVIFYSFCNVLIFDNHKYRAFLGIS